jgi:DNA-binding response OmpR family regulator
VKILVVEDNRKFARFVVRALTEEGYVVDHVGDGATAVTQAEAVAYDVIVLDWMLPELDGLSACREIRTRGAKVPILMLTALIAKVWQTSFDPGSNVVEVHIRNVREKLGEHAAMIETVRGVGYRLSSAA